MRSCDAWVRAIVRHVLIDVCSEYMLPDIARKLQLLHGQSRVY